MKLAAAGILLLGLALSAKAQAPAAPTLASPANNATGVSTTPTLTWNASTGATTYRMQLASDSLFLNVVLDDSTLAVTSKALGVLPNNASFYWRVSATNVSGTSAYSAIRRFTTVPLAPAAPVLNTPASGAIGVTTTSTLTWTASPTAASYRVQVSTDSTFATTVVNDSAVTGISRTTGSLAVSTVYYWRVNAKNAGGTSAYSSIQSFTTAAVKVPNTPTLVSPATNATGMQTSLSLIWRKDTTAATYHVQCSSDSSFATTLVNDSTLTDTTQALVSLTTATNYYWRVSSKNAGGTSAYTTTRRFTTISVIPNVPALTVPANNATNVAISTNLTWGTATGAATYHIQVSTDSNFVTNAVDDSTLAASPKAVGPLLNNTQYFWHVSAKNSFGSSAYSTRRGFRTVPLAPLAPVLGTPAANATSVATSTSLTWTASTGAATYRVQLSTDSTFATTTLNDSTVTATMRTVTNLTISTVYYWRVNAKNGGGTSAYTATRKFTTATVAFPTTPVLGTPANNATNIATSGSLVWRSVVGAATYHIQLASDTGFATLVINDSVVTDTTRAYILLMAGTNYYWRVRAKNATGTSAFATRRRFTTTAAATLFSAESQHLTLASGGVFQFNLPSRAWVQISLFDSKGRVQQQLLDEVREAGHYSIPMPAASKGSYYLLDFRAAGIHKTFKVHP